MRISVYRIAAGGSPSMEPMFPWPSIERVAGVEVLRHADHGRVDDFLAVRVVVTRGVAGDLGGLSVLGGRAQVEVVHRDQDAPLDRLEAVSDVQNEREMITLIA